MHFAVRRPPCPPRRRAPALIAVSLLLGIIACDHSAPFSPTNQGVTTPFQPGPIARLTYAPGNSRSASWLPDGSAFVYSYPDPQSAQSDRCIAVMPATGGRIQQLICRRTANSPRQTELLDAPAVSSEGRLVYSQDVRPDGATGLGDLALTLTSLTAPQTTSRLAAVPYTIAPGLLNNWISQTTWLSPTRLLFLGGLIGKITISDSITSGLDIVQLDFGTGTPILSLVPGTESASGVAAGDGGSFYFTVGGDTRVYKRDAGGGTTVVYDFAPEIVRDAQVVGNRLVAVVGGRVTFLEGPNPGQLVQWDYGGLLHVVDLAANTDQSVSLPIPAFVRRPALSPDGSRIVVEGYPLTITPNPPGPPDTVVSSHSDLWLVSLQ